MGITVWAPTDLEIVLGGEVCLRVSFRARLVEEV
jgi:hypothetical protein